MYAYNLIVVTIFTLPIIIFFKISNAKKILSLFLSILFILSLYIYGNYILNKNKRYLETEKNKELIKVISPNFELRYGLNEDEIEERLRKLIRYSEPNKEKTTLFVWPEGAFSGYDYNEILKFKALFKKSFSIISKNTKRINRLIVKILIHFKFIFIYFNFLIPFFIKKITYD